MSTALRLSIGIPISAFGLLVFAYPRYLVASVEDVEWSELGLLAVVRLVGGAIFVFGFKTMGHVEWPLWVNWLAIGFTGAVAVASYVYVIRVGNVNPDVTPDSDQKLYDRLFHVMIGSVVSTLLFVLLLGATLDNVF